MGALLGTASSAAPTLPSDFWPPAPLSPRVAPRKGAPRPHIIIHMTDDQGWANVGYHNPTHVITPTMDRLATKEGIRFERHYAFQWCAPSRASLMTGRLPYHVLEDWTPPKASPPSSTPPSPPSSKPPSTQAGHRTPTAVTRGMTMLPRKLQTVGYTTHQIGKWHLGMAMDWQTPAQRGFNSSFGYLGGGEDHNTQKGMAAEWGCAGTDLWETHGPAYGDNGTYGGYLYNDAAVRIIEHHPDPPANPLFLFLATQTMHAPVEVPSYYSDMYPNGVNGTYTKTYAISNGMATVTDSILANVTAALKRRGMWNHTLIIHLSDNGGPVVAQRASHANNYPLRGGKHTNWEGGLRVVAFASGGFLPAARHGVVLDGIMHNADWYPTLANLAGASPHDAPARSPGRSHGDVGAEHAATAVPGVDGFDMWPYITGVAAASPRSEVLISSASDGGIISGDYKLIFGEQEFSFWQAPVYVLFCGTRALLKRNWKKREGGE